MADPIKKIPVITDEIATTDKDIDRYSGWLNRLENPDPVLRSESNGKGLTLYDEVDRDGHAGAVLQTRYLAVSGKEWDILPGRDASSGDKGKASKAQVRADFVKDALEDINFDQAKQELLQGILYGYYVGEVIWQRRDGAIIPAKILGKHPRRFIFTPKRELRLITPSAMIEGENLPNRKFITFTYGSSDNPYGKGLGRKMWWSVWFKKHGIKFWMIFLEKFGMPTAIGKYPSGTSIDKQQDLLDAIDAIHTETGVKIPDSMAIDLLEAARTGNVTYETLCDYMDRQNTKTVLGQTGTTEVKDAGAYAAASKLDDVRQDILTADSGLLCECLNDTLIRWMIDYNFPGVSHYPKLSIRTKQESSQKDLAERDKIVIKDIGLPTSTRYMYDTYNIPKPEEGEDLVNPAPVTQEGPRGFSEAMDFSADNDAKVDRFVDQGLDKVMPIVSKNIQKIREFLIKARTLKQAKKDLFSLFEDLDSTTISRQLAKSMMMAWNLGVQSETDKANFEEMWGPGTAFKTAVEYFQNKAFTISKVANADILNDVHDEILKAMEGGMTLEDFQKDVETIFARHGVDPLSPFHIRTIFQTNLQLNYQAGRYRQMMSPAVTKARPYWRLVAVQDAASRPEHAAMHGMIFRYDHPFWDTWYPPNGFNCRCTVQTVSEREVERNGWKIEADDPTGNLFEPKDPVTGSKMPARPLMPDNGWNRNPVKDDWKPDLSKYPRELAEKLKPGGQG